MANKVIVRSKKVEEINDKDGVKLRRLNAIIEHNDIQEDELKHFGVMGMRWGVRKGSSDSSSSSKVSTFRKILPHRIVTGKQIGRAHV